MGANGQGPDSTVEPADAALPKSEERSQSQAASRHVISAVWALFLGWGVVALWNGVDIIQRSAPSSTIGTRLLHHVIDFGHVLTLALLTAGVTALWLRFGPRRLGWSLLAISVASMLVAQIVLREDLVGAVERVSAQGWLLAVACALTALLIPLGFALGRLCARPRLRWLGVALGVLLVSSNAWILTSGYPGVHALLSTASAILIAASLAGARTDSLRARLGRTEGKRSTRERSGWPEHGWALAAALGLALVTLVRKPPSQVLVAMLERDTLVLLPWLRAHYAPSQVGDVEIPHALRPAFESRKDRADLPPSRVPSLPPGPIVLVVTIDALRLEIFDAQNREVAPNLQEMRRNGVYFTQARSSGSDTRFSLATLFTGRYYSMQKWNFKRSKSRPTLELDELPRLPELLQRAKVATVTTVALEKMLIPKIGIVRGFDEQFDALDPVVLAGERPRTSEMMDQIIERLRRQGPGPMFFYTHIIDPHAPYTPRIKPVDSQYEAYLQEVTLADREFGRLRRAVKELGLADRTVWIVGSDHGEGFGEHGIFHHNKTLYDIMVHVPLMIQVPGIAPREVHDFVSLMDVGPTVLDLFGVPTPGYWMSESLVPYLVRGRSNPNRLIVMEKPREKAMLFPDGLKVFARRGTEEIYDIRKDPTESENLWDSLGDEAPRRAALMRAYLDVHSLRANPDEGADE